MMRIKAVVEGQRVMTLHRNQQIMGWDEMTLQTKLRRLFIYRQTTQHIANTNGGYTV